MTDLLTLERLADQSRRDTNLTKFAREEYRKLIDRKKTPSEDGFEIELPASIDIGQENALRLLEQHGYIKTSFEHHGSDGFLYRIDLLNDKFLSPPYVLLCFPKNQHLEFSAAGVIEKPVDYRY